MSSQKWTISRVHKARHVQSTYVCILPSDGLGRFRLKNFFCIYYAIGVSTLAMSAEANLI
jgi:hypothetical protein